MQQESPVIDISEFFRLFVTGLQYRVYKFCEFIRIACSFYSNFSFMKADISLYLMYLFENPYSISRKFLKSKKNSDIYTYGETPIPSLAKIAEVCGVTDKDHFYELGCGPGRACFWLYLFYHCRVTGIDYIDIFIDRAERIRKRLGFTGLTFLSEDFFEADLHEATVIYLYGTSMQDSEIKKLTAKFSDLRKGTKIITVSFPLSDYLDEKHFELMKCFPVEYPWGPADVYMQIKK